MSYTKLFGDKLVYKGELLNAKDLDLKGDDVLGVYFSAHWCPPCRGFTPKLAEFYEKVNAGGKKFRIVFVSADRDEGDFKSYFNSMPWHAVPFDDEETRDNLNQMCGVRGIPKLVLFCPNGEKMKIKGDARGLVTENPEGFPWQV